MSRLAGLVAKLFLGAAIVAFGTALVLCTFAILAASWPYRRLKRDSPGMAKAAAAQQLLIAVAAAATVFRARGGES